MEQLQAKLDGTYQPEPIDTPLDANNPMAINSAVQDMIDANDAAGIDFDIPEWAR